MVCLQKPRKSVDKVCSLNIFCLVCCFAHSSQKSSGSSHVLQKYVAFVSILSAKQGLQTIPLSFVFLLIKNSYSKINPQCEDIAFCSLKEIQSNINIIYISFQKIMKI